MAAAQNAGGWTPLHGAADAGHTAVVQVLLEAAPATAKAMTHQGGSPLCLAVCGGHAAVVQLLLAAAPCMALVKDYHGRVPLHEAAGRDLVEVVDLLLAAEPEAAEPEAAESWAQETTPLGLALDMQCYDAARRLLGFGSVEGVLAALGEWGHESALPLYADVVIARAPLTSFEWEVVRAPCPGLGRALPAALAHSTGQAGQLVARLLSEDAQRLRTAALCLARRQQHLGVHLPVQILHQVLGACLT